MALRPLEPESFNSDVCNSLKRLGDALPEGVSKDSLSVRNRQKSFDSAAF